MTVGQLEIGISVDGASQAKNATEGVSSSLEDVEQAAAAAGSQLNVLQSGLGGADSEANNTSSALEALSSDLDEAASSAGRARSEMTELTSGVPSSVRSVGTSAERASAGLDDIRSAAEAAEASVSDLANEQQRAAATSSSLRSSAGGSANALAFELTQAAQDARFGMAGLANQIPLIAEQFSRLSARTGGTTAALSSLGSTFTGPVGIIAAFTLAPAVIAGVRSAVSALGGSAEEADEEFKGLLDTTNQLSDGLPNLEQAVKGAQDRLEGIESSGLTGFGLVGTGLTDALETISTGAAGVNQVRTAIEGIQEGLRGSSQEAQVLRDALRSAGVDVDRILNANVRESLATTERVREELERSQDTLRQFAQDPAQFIEDPSVLLNSVQRTFSDFQDQVTQLEGITKTPLEGAQAEARFLSDALETAAGSFDLSQEQFRDVFAPLIQQLDQAQARVQRLKEEGDEPITFDVQLSGVDSAPLETASVAQEDVQVPNVEGPNVSLSGLRNAAQAADSLGDVNSVISQLRSNFDTLNNREAQRFLLQLQRQRQKLQQVSVVGQRTTQILRAGLQGVFRGVGNIVGALASGQEAFRSLQQVAQQVIQSIISQLVQLAAKLLVIQPIIGALTGGASLAAPSVAGVVGAGLFPSAASGGFVEEGGLARIHKGEHIVPAGEMGSTGGTLSASISMDELTFQLDKHLRRRGKSGLL